VIGDAGSRGASSSSARGESAGESAIVLGARARERTMGAEECEPTTRAGAIGVRVPSWSVAAARALEKDDDAWEKFKV
jgi:hypothetical protein